MLPEESRKAAAGALGREFGKFPLRFAVPLLFGEYPAPGQPPKINNGTATLLRLDCGAVAVTCFHVVDYYRERLRSGADQLQFQIAGCRLDPGEQVLSESEGADLAVLSLTAKQTERVLTWRSIQSHFYEPASWPPAVPAAGDDVLFGGYPGKWRTVTDYDSLQFASYSGGHRVTAVGTRTFFCEVDQEYCAKTMYLDGLSDLTEFGGMSGGPVFALRRLNLELVGFVREYSPDRDAFYFSLAHLIDVNGRITV